MAEKGSSSVVTDVLEERKRVALVSIAVLSGASSYIIMLFVAMPLAIHLIININNGCDVKVDDACFAPTGESQEFLTTTLTVLRVATFLMGTFVGVLSDKFGRKPLLLFALGGYASTAVLLTIGWASNEAAMFIIGAIVLGISSPITPHGIAYISDISAPKNLASNMGILQGVGFFIGLMTGAIIALAIGNATEDDEGNTNFDDLFYTSFGVGFAVSTFGALTSLCLLPESLHPNDRIESIDWKKANPLGFIPLVIMTPYMFLIWLSAFFGWISAGASEVVTAGWWLRRFILTEISDLITFLVLFWVASAVGAIIMTRVYVTIRGMKFAIHVSAFFTIMVGVAFSLSETATQSYSVIGITFFASPILPLTISLIMGQVGPSEKGAMAGAIRSSEALGKIIGIAIFGSAFAAYIDEFTPDASCIPSNYDGAANKANDCTCGVASCPLVLNGGATTKFVPSECSLGQLSARLAGTFNALIKNPDPELSPIPTALFENEIVAERPKRCRGKGLEEGTGGFDTKIDRLWCAGFNPLDPLLALGLDTNALLGCPGFNFQTLRTDGNILTCRQINATTQNFTGEPGATCLNDFLEFAAGNISQTMRDEDLEANGALYQQIAGNILNPAFDDTNYCGDTFEEGELNVCFEATVSDFPGLFPFLYIGGTGILSWIFFIIAELCFVNHDKEYWKDNTNVDILEAGSDVKEMI